LCKACLYYLVLYTAKTRNSVAMPGTFNIVHAFLWLRILVVGLCRRRPGFNASLVYVGLVVGLGPTRRILLGLILFSTDTLIPRTPHVYSFTCHRS